MTRRYIPVEEAFKEWRKDPEFVAAYDALEEEFAHAHATINTRAAADPAPEAPIDEAVAPVRSEKRTRKG